MLRAERVLLRRIRNGIAWTAAVVCPMPLTQFVDHTVLGLVVSGIAAGLVAVYFITWAAR